MRHIQLFPVAGEIRPHEVKIGSDLCRMQRGGVPSESVCSNLRRESKSQYKLRPFGRSWQVRRLQVCLLTAFHPSKFDNI